VFLRWRGEPDWDSGQLAQLLDVADRLIIDSTEWPDLPAAYARLAELFEEAREKRERWLDGQR
jgi:glucose-6-phosphate dehydrogenase assembly protein OpcA